MERIKKGTPIKASNDGSIVVYATGEIRNVGGVTIVSVSKDKPKA